MPPMTPSQRLFKLTQFILSKLSQEPEMQNYVGIRFDSEDHQQQSIIDKDNVGWVYVKTPPNGSEPPKSG